MQLTLRPAGARRTGVAGDEAGFTLTELLVTVVILGVIIFPLGNAVIGFIRLTDDTSVRLTESSDLQFTASYFGQDVQSTGTRNWTGYPYPLRQSVELGVPAAGGLYPCGAAGTPAAVVRLAWDDPQSTTTPPQVARAAYVIMPVGSEQQLHRILCLGSATPVADTVVARNIDPAGTSVSCSTTCTNAPDVPATITLVLSVHDPASHGTPSTVTLVGRRRQT